MILIKASAVLDSYQRSIIDQIEPFTGDKILTVSRGHSSPLEQLEIIKGYAEENSFLDGIKFPEWNMELPIDAKVSVSQIPSLIIVPEGQLVYWWQRIWSVLLDRYTASGEKFGAKINPPLPAACWGHYKNASGDMYGKIINPSPHIIEVDVDPLLRPCPIDFSGRISGVENLAPIVEIMRKAKDSGVRIHSIQPEPANGCVHINLERKVG